MFRYFFSEAQAEPNVRIEVEHSTKEIKEYVFREFDGQEIPLLEGVPFACILTRTSEEKVKKTKEEFLLWNMQLNCMSINAEPKKTKKVSAVVLTAACVSSLNEVTAKFIAPLVATVGEFELKDGRFKHFSIIRVRCKSSQ